VASLREMQSEFAASLRDPSVACAVLPADNLSIYRNNSAVSFRVALEGSYPVVRRRVGDDYFRQLTAQYRERFPSRSGDLHWIGRDFPAFLAEHLQGSEYAWLADLARLEWARSQASIAKVEPALPADVLGRFTADQLEHLVFGLQPSLQLVASDFPIFSVWLANQVENASPVDQSFGFECGMVRARSDLLEVRPLEPRLFSYLCALAAGAPLGEAISTAGLDQAGLVSALGFVFSEGLVSSVR
jgi:putative DNA-binding protein